MPSILDHILQELQTGKIVSGFSIVHGTGVDNLWSQVLEHIKTTLGQHAIHDLLEIKDYSKELGKEHIIRVENKPNTTSKILLKEHNYTDLGAREINKRLSHSPSGIIKVLLIEHIDRAKKSAANALLKSLEEPLPGRIIIASTQNKDLLLPTILSRALLIYGNSDYTAPALTTEQSTLFSELIFALDSNNIAKLSKLATTIAKSKFHKLCIQYLIYHYYTHHIPEKIHHCISSLQMISSNVSPEHTLFQLFLKNIK